MADRFLAFYLVGLVVQFALLSPVSNSDAENTSKSILSQGISLEGLSDTYPMLATFLSAILLLCAVAVPLQDQEVQASTVLIAPVVISLVGAASAAAFFLLALRVALVSYFHLFSFPLACMDSALFFCRSWAHG